MNNKEFDVVAAGIATWDTLLNGIDTDLMQVDSVQCESFSGASGGDAVNGAINLARLGMKVTLCACIGRDSEGQSIIDELNEAGVNTDNVTYDEKHHTASPVLLIDRKGDRHIIRVPDNANMYFTETMVSDEVLKSARHLHFASANVLGSMDGEPLGRLFKRAHELGLTTSLDASYDRKGNWMKNIEDALQNCDIFIPSLQEAAIYANSDDLDEICRFFSAYPLKIFGIKLGEKGVLVTDFHQTWKQASLYHGTPVDTTGAGDAFLAGFVSAWLKGYDIPSCAAIGSAQSCSVLGAIGANRSAGTWQDALHLLTANGIPLQKRKE
jgi:sugar/nucleoside kinase (ribokinase family)